MDGNLLCKIYHTKAKVTIAPLETICEHEGVYIQIDIGNSNKRLAIPFNVFLKMLPSESSSFLPRCIDKLIDEMEDKKG